MGSVKIPKALLDPTGAKYKEAPNLFVEDCFRIAGEYGVDALSLLTHMARTVANLARRLPDKQEQLHAIVRCFCDAGYPPPS